MNVDIEVARTPKTIKKSRTFTSRKLGEILQNFNSACNVTAAEAHSGEHVLDFGQNNDISSDDINITSVENTDANQETSHLHKY